MFSILKHLDGSALYSLGFWYDDGRRYLVAHRVMQEEIDRIKEEFARAVVDCTGIDKSLQYLPLIHEN
jgi:hypothetical protein